MSTAIGIDLGTTYSCVGVYQNHDVVIIPNELGERTTPSIVTFDNNNKSYVGESGKIRQVNFPNSTIYDSKRLIGRQFNSEEVQQDIKYWPFNIIEDPITKKANIEIDLGENGKKIFRPEEISAMVLKKLKENAEEFLDKEVTDAVITVPAYFNDNQRQSTKDAAKIAGLNVLRLINEPTAASIAYGLEKNINDNKTIIVLDFGGGTYDVSLLKLSKGYYDVLATSGDSHLGGNDIDQLLVDYCIKEFKQQTGYDISKEKRSVQRIRNICEKAKRVLSDITETPIDIDGIYKGEDFYITMVRATLENLCKNLFNRLIEPIESVLDDGNVNKNDIDEIILVGGSTKIPKVKEIIHKFFDKVPNDTINPDEAVAYGAAVSSQVIKNSSIIRGKKLILLDITPFSLGIEVLGKKFSNMISRGTYVPHTYTQQYVTVKDYQSSARITVYEGEYENIEDNNKLGEFILKDLPLMKAGKCKIDVTLNIDCNSILNVKAYEKTKGLSKEIKIINDKGILNENEINESKIKINNGWEKAKNISEENFKKNIQDYEKSFKETNSYDILVKLINNTEKFIDTFNQKLILTNKTLKQKFNTYLDYLFNYYQKALLNKSIEDHFREHIKDRFLSYITFYMKYDINIFVEKISEFQEIPEFYYYLMIQILNFYLQNGLTLLEINKNKALNEFNNGIFFSMKNNIENNIKTRSENIRDNYFYVYDQLELGLKRIKIEKIMSNAEELLSLGDKEKDNEKQIDYYNSAVDKYREAYQIIMSKITIEQINVNSLTRQNSVSYFNLLYLNPKNSYNEDDSLMIPEINEGYTIDIKNEAKCISRIIYIIYMKLNNNKNVEKLLTILQHCSQLIDSHIDKSNIYQENWYLDIIMMKNNLNKELESLREKSDLEMIEKNRKKYPSKYKEIEDKSKKQINTFIKFILEKYPYKDYKKDEFNIDDEIEKRIGPFLLTLHQSYHPDNYPKNNESERDFFCLMSFIDSKITELMKKMCPNKLDKKVKLKKKLKKK